MHAQGGVDARIQGEKLGLPGYEVQVAITMLVRDIRGADDKSYRLLLNERCREWFFAGMAAVENDAETKR